MADWKITKVDNSKKVYEAKRQTGEVLSIAVPKEHHHRAAGHVQDMLDAHDARLAVKAADSAQSLVSRVKGFFRRSKK